MLYFLNKKWASEGLNNMRVAVIGCGFVADLYIQSFRLHPEMEVAGVYDRDLIRSAKFAAYYSLPVFKSLEELLNDRSIELIVNLTNPSSHFDVSRACLEAGKHVYSEKPLSLNLDQSRELVALAHGRGLHISTAPCNLLGETAQTIWKSLRKNIIGKVRLAYASLDTGMIYKMPYKKWASASGTPWPYLDEFRVGCTVEHAAYYISWLAAFWGPILTVTAFSSCRAPDKIDGGPEVQTPDFSVACIKFSSGAVARLTCGIIAPHDNSLMIIGDDGILYTKECWDLRAGFM